MKDLLTEIRACQICQDLPLGPRPIIRAQKSAKLLIIGQAPGTKVHETGIPWNDPSGDRLRNWLQVDRDVFYDDSRIAIMPMGLCYPGRMDKGGDKPPRKECAPAWHARVLAELENTELTLLVGSYAQNYYLAGLKKKTMTETIRHFEDYLDQGFFPLPHPSWRVTQLLAKNPWMEEDVMVRLRSLTAPLLRD